MHMLLLCKYGAVITLLVYECELSIVWLVCEYRYYDVSNVLFVCEC